MGCVGSQRNGTPRGWSRRGGARLRVHAKFDIAIEEFPGQSGQLRDGGPVDQQGFDRVADADAMQLGIERDVACHDGVGFAIDIDVADALVMFDDGHL